MWGAFRIGLLGATASLLGAASAGAEPVRLTDEAIKSTVAGAIVELDTPFGTKIPVKFSSDGLMAGEAGMLAGFLGAERDRGRWWVESDRLCMKWFRWFDAEAHCMSLRQQGALIFWQEQGGRSGTARIAGKLDEKPAIPTYAAASVVLPKLVVPPSASQPAESQVGQPAQPSAAITSRAEPHNGKEAEGARAPAPAAEPTSSPASSAGGPVDVAAAGPRESAQIEQARSQPKRIAAPPLPVRSATRRSAPAESDVRVPSFSVVRVANDDVLNVRVGPSEYHQRIGALPPDGRGISIVGPCHGLWCPIRYGRLRGWVNSYYLAAEIPSASARTASR